MALLPADWPGQAARTLCGEIYRALLPASEQWLDRHGTNETGPLPPAGKELARRFAERSLCYKNEVRILNFFIYLLTKIAGGRACILRARKRRKTHTRQTKSAHPAHE